MTTTLATADFLAKRIYRSGLDDEALTSGNHLLKHVAREKDFASNQGIYIPVQGSNGQGMGPTNATAYTARVGVKGQVFVVPQRRLFHFGELDSEVVRNAEAGGSETQFASALTRDIDGATENFGQELNINLYGRNLGERSRVHSTTAPSGATLTLANPEDAALYAQDMLIQAINPADGTLRDADAVLVTKVDPILGTLTGSTTWTTTITGLAVGDILIRSQMRLASLDGLQGWCPETANLSASFLGVDQTINRMIYAGCYVDVSNFAIRPGLIRAWAVAEGQLGRGFNKRAPLFMNPADKAEIISSVEAVKVVETTLDTKYDVGLEAVEVLGATIVSDRHCPVGRAFQVPAGSFTFGTAGNQPMIDAQDGKRFHYDRPTGKLQFVLAMDGNSYSRKVQQLVHVKLPVRTTNS